jgi:hypothetical protein
MIHLRLKYDNDGNIISTLYGKKQISYLLVDVFSAKFRKDEPEGTISISCQRKDDDKDDNNNNYVLVKVKDRGEGIDHEIFQDYSQSSLLLPSPLITE